MRGMNKPRTFVLTFPARKSQPPKARRGYTGDMENTAIVLFACGLVSFAVAGYLTGSARSSY